MKMPQFNRGLSRVLGLGALLAALLAPGLAAAQTRPNFLVIVADDLGFSDLGAFGGEILTPNLDALAARGVRMSGFYTAPTCSPTRSMLLSGVDHHQAGIGAMAEALTPVQRGAPGYEGFLNDRVVTLPELLQAAGYRTLMSGKWHLGREENQSPAARGFERSFALLGGLHNHFGQDQTEAWKATGQSALYREDGKPASYPEGRYSSDYFADRLIGYLEEGANDPRPFFAYFTFTAPHWPLQAPAEAIAKYKGRYDKGPAALRAERLSRLKALGLVPPNVRPHDFEDAGDWEKLSPEERAIEARKMEVFAAMVERLDQNVGRVLETLRLQGKLDNTVIVFISDNGAEGTPFMGPPSLSPEKVAAIGIDNSLGNIGAATSYVGYGPGWAQAATSPSRLQKGYTTEGGIRVPAIVAGPGVVPGRIVDAFLSVSDIQPTFLAMAGVDHPASWKGRPVLPQQGRSWSRLLAGAEVAVRSPDEPFGWELFYRRGLRLGDWKVVYLPRSPDGAAYSRLDPIATDWELYNLQDDPGETRNLARERPEKLKELVSAWNAYAREVGVITPPGLPPVTGAKP